MAEKYAKIVQADKRGQIVIPKNIREELAIEDGAGFWIYKTEDGIYLEKIAAPSSKSIKKKIGGL